MRTPTSKVTSADEIEERMPPVRGSSPVSPPPYDVEPSDVGYSDAVTPRRAETPPPPLPPPISSESEDVNVSIILSFIVIKMWLLKLIVKSCGTKMFMGIHCLK